MQKKNIRKNLKILLLKCQRIITSQFQEIHEPLSLAYLSSILREEGFEVTILDASILKLSLNEIFEILFKEKYNLIGFTIPDPTYIEPTLVCIKKIKEEGLDAHLTIGGFTPTFHCKEIFEICPELDSIIRFEGEETLKALAKSLDTNREWRTLSGISFLDNNNLVLNRPRPLIKDLDKISFAARDILYSLIQRYPKKAIASLSTSRGCNNNCSFCAVNRFYSIPKGNNLRLRSNKNIADEIESIYNSCQIKEFLFVDDIFIGSGNKNGKRMLEFANELENRKLSLLFSISDRVDNINPEIMSRLRQVGLRQIFFGIESGNQEIINEFNKNITIKQIENAIKVLENLDIDYEASFINFTHNNSLEDIEQNLNFLLSLDLNILQGLLNRLKPYGGTVIYEQFLNNGKLKGKFPNFSFSNNKDPRVDILYDIVKNCFGHFLLVSYKIKEIKRIIRKKLFKTQYEKDRNNYNKMQILKYQFQQLHKAIMLEASNLFREALSFTKTLNKKSNQNIKDFKKMLLNEALIESQNWLNMLIYFEKFCLNLSFNRKEIYEKR